MKSAFAAAACACVIVFAGTAFAADKHDHGHAHTPLHGGVVVEVKDVDYELVATATAMRLYLRDHGKPVDVSQATGKLTLLSGAQKQDVVLKPTAQYLEAQGAFTLAPGTKAAVVVTRAGKPANVRFVLK